MLISLALLLAWQAPPSVVAGIPVNYDEALTGAYQLPDPLVMTNGQPVRDAKTWTTKRRPEIVRIFEEQQYGKSPGKPAGLRFEVFDRGTPAFEGKAIRRQVTIHFAKDKKADLLLYLPAGAKKKAPMLLHLSFAANSTTVDDPGIKPGEIWNREKQRVPASTGRSFGKINVLPFLAAGFGVATMYYGDVDPDFDGGFSLGVRQAFAKPGQTAPAADEWGSIAAWAWGLSRALDYLETDKDVDAKQVAILGVSRLGKTVMWAGAHDPRFAMVIASCSGEGGAALSKRNYGENVKHLNVRYGYQLAGNYQKWGDDPSKMPMDANLLVALIAPRPLLLQTGDKDLWSDPHGEFLSAVAAEPVYRLFGKQGLGTDQMPKADERILHTIGYSMHVGGHGTVPADWGLFLDFMKLHFKP